MRVQTNYRYQQARAAIDGTMMSMVGDDRASRVVSAADKRQVWLTADILASDETVMLRWRTTNGIEVARDMALRIDNNLAALLAAISNTEVNA
jgi:hypothetical protein